MSREDVFAKRRHCEICGYVLISLHLQAKFLNPSNVTTGLGHRHRDVINFTEHIPGLV